MLVTLQYIWKSRINIIIRPHEGGYIDSLLWHVSTGYLTTKEVRLIILLPDSPGQIMVSFMVLLIPAYINVRPLAGGKR